MSNHIKERRTWRYCARCRGTGVKANGNINCYCCHGKGWVYSDSLPAPTRSRELYLSILHTLKTFGPCMTEEICTLLKDQYPRRSILAALRALNGRRYIALYRGLIAIPDSTIGSWCQPCEFRWSLNDNGGVIRRSYCPECHQKSPKHISDCSQSPPVGQPHPSVIIRLLSEKERKGFGAS